jgi:branched-chain amino acid transport system substrate-binding protein
MTTRRRILQSLGAAGIVGLAGCTGDDDGDDEETADPSNDTDTDSGDDTDTDSGDDTDTNSGDDTADGTDTEMQEIDLKIGALLPLSGPFATAGATQDIGIEIGVNRLRDQHGELNLEIQRRDTELTPEVALRGARELVESEDVDGLIGPTSSAAAFAVSDYAQQQQVPVISPAAANPDLTGEDCHRYFFRFNEMSVHSGSSQAPWSAENLGDTYTTLALDYAWGQGEVEWFDHFAEQHGLEKSEEIWVPLGSSDFSSFVQQVDSTEADFIVFRLAGQDGVGFIDQANSFGLFDDTTFMTIPVPGLINATGNALAGQYGATSYMWELDTEKNERFKSEFRELDDQDLGRPESRTMNAKYAIEAFGRGAVNAGQADPEEVIEQVRGMEFDDPLEMRVRPSDHSSELPFHIIQMRESDEHDVLVREILDVSEIGTNLVPAEDYGCEME